MKFGRSPDCRWPDPVGVVLKARICGAINAVGADGLEASSYLRHFALYLQDQRQEQLRPI